MGEGLFIVLGRGRLQFVLLQSTKIRDKQGGTPLCCKFDSILYCIAFQYSHFVFFFF
jgi:hypothetical protein